MSDQTERIERRDGGLVADLYREHADWLVRRLRRRFGDEGEDLAHDAWRRMILAYGEAAAVRSPKALLLTIARRLATEGGHRRARHEAYVDIAGRTSPGAAVVGQEEHVLLKQIILGLPDDLRDVFLLSRLDGLTNAQIGERLGISPKTVEWRMTRALAHCAAQLRR